MPWKLGKTMRIFVEIGHITFWLERIGPVFPHTIESLVTILWPNLWLLFSIGNTGQILYGQNVTLWFLMWPISMNILKVLANFLGIHNSIFLKNIGCDCGNTRWDLGTRHKSWLSRLLRKWAEESIWRTPQSSHTYFANIIHVQSTNAHQQP